MAWGYWGDCVATYVAMWQCTGDGHGGGGECSSAEGLSGSGRALEGVDAGLGAWGPGGLAGVGSSALGWNLVQRRWRRALGVVDWWARFRHSGRTRKNLPWEVPISAGIMCLKTSLFLVSAALQM